MRALGSERPHCRPAEAPSLSGRRLPAGARPPPRRRDSSGEATLRLQAPARTQPRRPYIGGNRTTRYTAETATVTSMTGKPYFMKPPKVIS